MLLTELLNNGETPESLKTKYAIGYKRHGHYPNLVLFKYNQIDSPMHEPVVQAARGVILDENNGWAVVSWPFNKFFNHSETLAAAIDWSTAACLEKLDGSLCTLYYYDNAWHVATSGTPDAAGEVNDFGFSFKDLFWKAFNDLGYKLPTDQSTCLMFELMTPYNRVVVRHDFNRLVLIGARNLKTGVEIKPEDCSHLGYEVVRAFQHQNLDATIASMTSIDPVRQEGYVVVDDNFNRVKIKHPGYVSLHHLRSNLSMRRILELVLLNEGDEVVAYFPEFSTHVATAKAALLEQVAQAKEDYAQAWTRSADRKGFAFHAVKSKFSDALFKAYGKTGASEQIELYIRSMPADKLCERLGLDAKIGDIQ